MINMKPITHEKSGEHVEPTASMITLSPVGGRTSL
jgi:hypothetical protein